MSIMHHWRLAGLNWSLVRVTTPVASLIDDPLMMVCVGSGTNDRKRTAKLSRSLTVTSEAVKVVPGLNLLETKLSPMKAFDRLWPVDDVRIVTVSLKYPSDFWL